MKYEVVYTMSRAATEAEWTDIIRLAGRWLEQCAAEMPGRFDGADLRLGEEALHVELAGTEDLVIEREGTISIWSARAATAETARVLSGVLLSAQYVLTAATMQLSGSKAGLWQSAAAALEPVWEAPLEVRVMAPRKFKADALVYLDHGANAQILRDYFRTHLELDEAALPDRDFRDVLADA